MVTILKIPEVPNYVKKLKQKQKSLVVAGGCFDLLHIGHVTLLENAKKKGDVLIVLLESDKAIEQKKGINRPIHSQRERALLLTALRAVDIVVCLPDSMSNEDYDNVLFQIQPKVIATTKNDPFITHKERQAKKIGAKVIAVNEYIPSVSTTKLLKILSQEM